MSDYKWAFWIMYDSEPMWGPFDGEIEAHEFAVINCDDNVTIEYRDFPHDAELAP